MEAFNDFKKGLNEKNSDTNVSVANETTWKNWRTVANMTSKELESFHNNENSDYEIKNPTQNDNLGWESYSVIKKMIDDGGSYSSAEKKWTPKMWWLAEKTIKIVERGKKMRKRMVGNPFTKNGMKSRWYISQLTWGYDPRKPERKV